MKEIKAFVHRNRIADVVRALRAAGYRNLSVIDVKGILHALSSKEQDYSIEFGGEVITEVKLELFCNDETTTAQAVDIIQTHGRTGQPEAGWIFISEVSVALPIGDC